MSNENLLSLNLQPSGDVSEFKYAVYLPAIQKNYLSAVAKDVSVYGSRLMPDFLKTGLGALNFLDDRNAIFSYGAGLYSVANALQGSSAQSVESLLRPKGASRTTIVGDSSGYQLGTGAMKIDLTDEPKLAAKRQQILEWLENNCDVAMTIDFPTWAIGRNGSQLTSFDQCLNGTIKNLRHFSEKRTNASCKLLNVIQGNTISESKDWYEHVKDYQFEGWAFAWGSTGSMEKFLLMLLHMRDGKSLDKCEWVHVLGISRARLALGLTAVMNALRKEKSGLVVSYDSSNPFLLAGTGMRGFSNWITSSSKRKNENQFSITDYKLPADKSFIGQKIPFPFLSSPVGTRITVDHLCVNKTPKGDKSSWDDLSYALVSAHNTYVQIKSQMQISKMAEATASSKCDFGVPAQYLDLMNVVEKAFSSENGRGVLNQNRNVLEWFDRKNTIDINIIQASDRIDWGSSDLAPWISGEGIDNYTDPEHCSYD